MSPEQRGEVTFFGTYLSYICHGMKRGAGIVQSVATMSAKIPYLYLDSNYYLVKTKEKAKYKLVLRCNSYFLLFLLLKIQASRSIGFKSFGKTPFPANETFATTFEETNF